ncbi:MAG: diguanylate cyclase with PAS/PAC sensor, partial [uncultured bacterium]
SRDMGVLVVNSYFQRVNEIVQQISARINNQHVMTEYTEGKITKTTQSQRHAVLEKIFQNSLLLHSDLMSISQFSSDGKLSLIVGKNIIPINAMREMLKNRPLTDILFMANQKNYLLKIFPVKNMRTAKTGDNVFIFKLEKLENMMREELHTKSDVISIFFIQNKKPHWIFLNKPDSRIDQLFQQDFRLNEKLTEFIEKNKSSMISELLYHKGVFVTYAPISKIPWGVVVAENKKNLYHTVKHVILILVPIVVLILLFFVIGMSIVLKPLSGRLLIEHNELQGLVEKSQGELKVLNDQLYQLAMYDSLTNALTRRAFHNKLKQEISRCERYKRLCALLYLDIDNFKIVNDTFGHDAGDFLLKELSTRMHQLIRKVDVFARLGGDEFAVLLPEISNDISLPEIIARIKANIALPLQYQKLQFSITVSIGAAVYPTDGETIDELIKIADCRMYHDKNLNKINNASNAH